MIPVRKVCPVCGGEWIARRQWQAAKRTCGRACSKQGAANPNWKGEKTSKHAKRSRIQRALPMGPCERCAAPGMDRHHKDGDTGNNRRENISILCRRCHMTVDGRLAEIRTRRPPLLLKQPPKPCTHCAKPDKPLKKGRCDACYRYWRRHERDRPPALLANPGRWGG
jgi:hypothetical protein